MYQPTLNRFIARDPLSADGVDVIPNTGWFGERLDTMRERYGTGPGGDVNLYRYVGNSPVLWVDPSGALPGYGYYCGPRTSSLPPIDCIDEACQWHDNCIGPLWKVWMIPGRRFYCDQVLSQKAAWCATIECESVTCRLVAAAIAVEMGKVGWGTLPCAPILP